MTLSLFVLTKTKNNMNSKLISKKVDPNGNEILAFAKEHLSVKHAKEILEKHGFCVDNLWHISDVNEFYICDDDTAQSILAKSLNNHDSVFESIDYFANELNLERK